MANFKWNDINSLGFIGNGVKTETKEERIARLLNSPALSDEAYDFEKQYFAQRDATATSQTQYPPSAKTSGTSGEKKPAAEKKQDNDKKDTSTSYGGFILQRGDNDKKKIWGGKSGKEEGQWVEELQKDLVKLGYWISNPSSNKGKGMTADGDFGANVEKAVKTAQLELLCLKSDGSVDGDKKELITGKADCDTANAIKKRVKAIGNKTWDRPGHKPKSKWKELVANGTDLTDKEYAPDDILFYQLPPSEGYCRRSVIEYGSRDEKTKEKTVKNVKTVTIKANPCQVFGDDDAEWLMVDCWGVKKQIELLKKIGDTWLKTDDGKERIVTLSDGTEKSVRPFCIGDISMFNGGAMTEHAGHREGDSADLNRSDKTNMNSVESFSTEEDMLETLELMKLLEEEGAKNIYCNCHYIISNCGIAQYYDGHFNHVHFDGPESGKKSPDKNQKVTTCKNCNRFDNCDHRIFKIRNSSKEKWCSADLYTTDMPCVSGKGLPFLGDKNGNRMVISKVEWDKLPEADKIYDSCFAESKQSLKEELH